MKSKRSKYTCFLPCMNLSEKAKQDLVFQREDNVKEAPAFSSLNNFSETDAQVAAGRTGISQLGLQLL